MLKTGPWQDHTSADFTALDAERTVALLPVAAVEQHGPHLPLATDALINEGILHRTMALLPPGLTVPVLPPVTVGHSLEHTAFPGTLSVTAETLLGLWTDLGRSVARAGVCKLVVFNTHGGQVGLVDLLATRLRVELGMLVVRANCFAFGLPPGLFDPAEALHGIHGGEVETALLLHLRPDLVRREALASFEASTFRMGASHRWLGPEKPIGFGWMSQDLHPQGVSGDAARADAERGRALLEYLAKGLADLVSEVAATPLAVLED